MQTSDIDNRFDFHPATTAAKRGDHGSVRNACAELAHLINHPSWKAGSKRLVTVAVSIALTLLVLVFYYAMTVDLVPSWPIMVLLALAIGQDAYIPGNSRRSTLRRKVIPGQEAPRSP